MTQITFGTGPDFSPMPDPGGKGIYYVNGKSSGFLTAYNVHSKQSTDIVAEKATQPVISPDGKRISYVTTPSSDEANCGRRIGRQQQSENRFVEVPGYRDWAPDSFHLFFMEEEPNRIFIAGADGSGVHQLPRTRR